MSTKTNLKSGWTMPAVDQDKALWGKAAAVGLPRGYDVKLGTNGKDTMTGTNDAIEAFDGRGGNDTIRGLGGLDYVMGGSGNDRIYPTMSVTQPSQIRVGTT